MNYLKTLSMLLIAISIFSCSDDEDPTFKKSDLIGKWEETSSTVESGDDCEQSGLEFSDTELNMWSVCDGNPTSVEVEYTYDGKRNITFDFLGDIKVTVTSLNSTTLKTDWYYNGQKAGSASYKKI